MKYRIRQQTTKNGLSFELVSVSEEGNVFVCDMVADDIQSLTTNYAAMGEAFNLPFLDGDNNHVEIVPDTIESLTLKLYNLNKELLEYFNAYDNEEKAKLREKIAQTKAQLEFLREENEWMNAGLGSYPGGSLMRIWKKVHADNNNTQAEGV